MTLKQFKLSFEPELEEKWNGGERKNYANYDSFCWHEWQNTEHAEVEE